MKAFLLAAGNGTRLRPLTDTIPKCLVPIRGKPMLNIWLELCARVGIDEVLINLHHRADAVREFLQSVSLPVTVQVVEEPELLGSAGTVAANRSWVEAEREFWVFYAEVLTAVDLSAMLGFHRARGKDATLGVYEVDEPSRCGIVETDADGTVRQFVEKPKHPIGNLAFSGLMVAGPALLDAIPATVPADLGYDVFPGLATRMAAYPIREYLLDVGTLRNYEQAQATWPGI